MKKTEAKKETKTKAPKVEAPKASTKAKATIRFQQYASGAGKSKSQQGTLIGLGLGKVNKVSELEDTIAVRGMFAKVKHLVKQVN